MDNQGTLREQPSASWASDLNSEDCEKLDVRSTIASGGEPLPDILEKADALASEKILMIIAPFDPLPLRRLMASRGFECHLVQKSTEEWHVYFKRGKNPSLPELPDLPSFPMQWRENILEMDLRELIAPNPMIAILKIIESGEGGNMFRALLNREPIYLYPELAERKWKSELIEQSGDTFKVEITRQADVRK